MVNSKKTNASPPWQIFLTRQEREKYTENIFKHQIKVENETNLIRSARFPQSSVSMTGNCCSPQTSFTLTENLKLLGCGYSNFQNLNMYQFYKISASIIVCGSHRDCHLKHTSNFSNTSQSLRHYKWHETSCKKALPKLYKVTKPFWQ